MNKYHPSKYKYVAREIVGSRYGRRYEYWVITLPNHSRKRYKSEKEAAISVDTILISQGKDPMNVLKKAVKK